MKSAIVSFVLLVLMSSFVLAAPMFPHGFYGNVYYSDGNLITENLQLRAEIDGEVYSCVLSNGKYDLVVEYDDEGEDIIVNFYIQGLTSPIGNHEFEFFEITELNFYTALTNPNSNSPSTSGDSGGGGGGGSSGSSDTQVSPNDEGIIDLSNSDGELPETEKIENNKNAGTFLGAVLGFVKSEKGVALLSGLFVAVLAATFLIIQKKKVK